jgi:hypothetical protein
MLQLASLQNDQEKEYEELLATDELRHPLLASLRLHVQSKPQKSEPEAIVKESYRFFVIAHFCIIATDARSKYDQRPPDTQ